MKSWNETYIIIVSSYYFKVKIIIISTYVMTILQNYTQWSNWTFYNIILHICICTCINIHHLHVLCVCFFLKCSDFLLMNTVWLQATIVEIRQKMLPRSINSATKYTCSMWHIATNDPRIKQIRSIQSEMHVEFEMFIINGCDLPA